MLILRNPHADDYVNFPSLLCADAATYADDYVSRKLHALVDDILLPTFGGKVPESDALSVGQAQNPSTGLRHPVAEMRGSECGSVDHNGRLGPQASAVMAYRPFGYTVVGKVTVWPVSVSKNDRSGWTPSQPGH